MFNKILKETLSRLRLTGYDIRRDKFDAAKCDIPDQINWNDRDHQRIIAAMMVKAVYVLHSDESRTEKLAAEWWERANFTKVEEFSEEGEKGLFGQKGGKNIFGAVFKPNILRPHASRGKPPSYIIAFRGAGDLWDVFLDIVLMYQMVYSTDRMKIAHRKVKRFIHDDSSIGPGSKFWLAGHSLGASVATTVAIKLVEEDNIRPDFFETFLFNPPFLGQVICDDRDYLAKMLLDWNAKLTAQMIKMYLIVCPKRVSRPWVPNVYVNPGDIISLGFYDYFEQGLNVSGVEEEGRIPIGYFFTHDEAKNYLLPAARLTSNHTAERFRYSNLLGGIKQCLESHDLGQWWRLKLPLSHYKEYSSHSGKEVVIEMLPTN